MTATSNQQATIIRTGRGLTIAGTRITLYQLMDHLQAGQPPQSFREYFPQITDVQFNTAIAYIAANRAEVEADYQIVLKQAAENRQYWEKRNQERLARIAYMPPKPGREALWQKLQAQKAMHQSQT